ncbi:hypothetical protein [Catenulispora rubra]|uniref:hypothetical protein n=1 Tax=Catenulispora rubra TaxID=280293 RepID=UPI0018924FD3|nr:hypothetical protein [Catenulispora rubra]
MTNRIRGGAAGRLLAGLSVLMSSTSCALLPPDSKGGPPTVVCNKTLSRNPAGPVVNDATEHDITVTAFTEEDVIMLRVAPGCHSGAAIAIEPTDAAAIVDSVRASDGHYTAVVLRPRRGSFVVRVTRSATSTCVVTVQGLTVAAPTSSSSSTPSTPSSPSSPSTSSSSRRASATVTP